MTLPCTTRYFNCGFYYYKYILVEVIFKETRLNKICENKFPSKITCYTVVDTGDPSWVENEPAQHPENSTRHMHPPLLQGKNYLGTTEKL